MTRISRLKTAKLLAATALVFLALPRNATAINKTWTLGNRIEITPSFSITTGGRSNVFYEDDSGGERPKDDFAIVFSPSIRADYTSPSERFELSLRYILDFERFVDLTEENTIDDKVSFDAKYRHPSGRFSASIEDDFAKTKEAVSNRLSGDRRFSREDRIENRLAGSVTTALGRSFSVSLSYSNFFNEFDKKAVEFENFYTNSYGVALFYRLSPLISPTINYRISDTTYPDNALNATTGFLENSDSTSQRVSVGVSMDATAKVSGSATVGVSYVDFEETDRNDGTTTAADVTLEWQARDRTVVNVNLSQGFGSTSGDDGSNPEATTITLGVDQKIGRKVTANASTGFEYAEYDEFRFTRRDRTSFIEIGADYSVLSWLDVGLDYRYESSVSNDNPSEYRVNELSVAFNARF